MPPALITASLYLRPILELLSVTAQDMPTMVVFVLLPSLSPEDGRQVQDEHANAAKNRYSRQSGIIFLMVVSI